MIRWETSCKGVIRIDSDRITFTTPVSMNCIMNNTVHRKNTI